MVIGYGITFVIALVLLIAYMLIVKQKQFWLTMLYVCVSVVNLGYLLLSIAKSLEFAIFANDLAYLGSVFLCMCMLLTIVELCGFKIKRWQVITCLSLALVMFALVATSEFSHLYYKSVRIETVSGATKLIKEYGILHDVYTVYLIAYFIAMLTTIIYSAKKNKIGNSKFAGFLAGLVCGNIVFWLFEKFINWEFELLSVTYIISELILLLLYWMMQDYVLKGEVPTQRARVIVLDSMPKAERIERVLKLLPEDKTLTTRQMEMLDGLLEGKSQKEIAAELHISENTVKWHLGILYATLNVSGKDEILALFK